MHVASHNSFTTVISFDSKVAPRCDRVAFAMSLLMVVSAKWRGNSSLTLRPSARDCANFK
jgi:hypothetical protein